ncbi:DUF1631 family protein [Gilvimarinus sp. DA14]|uniref:DUF1631 family protein n=1 Tax=Gilvimarinus sp. DA14 TaxID=2956798 RepID=UPI0020B65887|nr:DUF1631 family protein [Gilvimarinus sp. DA14]UTF59391.1 DUF1631 domain-containing protein [Gilvimarinus sp. DA14]
MNKPTGEGVEPMAESSQSHQAYNTLSQAQVSRYIEACVAATDDYVEQNFPTFWGDWIKSIEKREEHARSNKEQVALGEIIKLLQQRAVYIQRHYLELLHQCFKEFARRELVTATGQERFARNEGLTLVDNSDLEETIAITSICHRSDSQLAEPLWALHQRLALLNGGKKIDERGNPVSPIQFCDTLRRALENLALDARTKVVGYKHFEAALIKPLAGLYEDLNAFLASQGILTNLRYSAVMREESAEQAAPGLQDESGSDSAEAQSLKSQEPEQSAPRRRATDRIFADAENRDPAQYQQGLVSAIKLLQTHLGANLLAGGQSRSPAASPQRQNHASTTAHSAGAHAGIEPLVGAVGVLQQQLATQAKVLADVSIGEIQPQPVASVSSQLVDELKKSGDRDGRSDEMYTIELVGLLFEYILSDDQLPDSVKALLSYLHTPVLKLAFIDKEFFENVDHPARVLLNQMAEAGARWVSNDGSSQYNIFEKIKTTVFQVLEKFGNDVKVFAEASLEFSSYIRNVSRRQDLMEKRAMEKARGEEKLREAKILVNTKVSHLIDGRDLPSPVLLLLLLPWSDYLSFVILRYGADSDSCQRALQVAQNLIWSVEPKLLEVDKVKQLEMQDALLQALQAGFETIGYEQNKSRKLLDAIAGLQKLALKSQKAEPAPEPMRAKLESMAAEKAGNVDIENTNASAEEAKLIEKLKLIEFGTWLEDDKGKRIKVAWYNHKTMHYMLVDQQGRKVAMSSALQMARAMIAGKLRIIAGSTKPFFERALENIYHSLNARASGELLNRE